MTTTGNQLLCLHGSTTIKFRKQVLNFHKQRNRQTDRHKQAGRHKQAERHKHTDKNKQTSEEGKKS